MAFTSTNTAGASAATFELDDEATVTFDGVCFVDFVMKDPRPEGGGDVRMSFHASCVFDLIQRLAEVASLDMAQYLHTSGILDREEAKRA